MDADTERREFPWRVRLARRGQGLTLEALARRVGVTKGALSRYESGDVRVLGESTVRLVCEALGLPVPEWLSVALPAVSVPSVDGLVSSAVPHCCLTPFCRLNRPLLLPGQVRFLPSLVLSQPDGEVVCRYCGGTLVSACPSCGAPLEPESGVCPSCGADYVAPAVLDAQTMALLQFNAAASAPAPVAGLALPYWAPMASRPAARVSGVAESGSAGSSGGSVDGGTA